jgi:twitching motility protein PilI
MSLAHINPFQWLCKLEQLTKQNAQGLPATEIIQKTWSGIAFKSADCNMVAPLTDIREVLVCPQHLAKVPGTKPWVKGIANLRGQLLIVIDLQACLGKEALTLSNDSRLMIINHVDGMSGILVDEVFGIKHFLENSMEKCSDTLRKNLNNNNNNSFTPFITGEFNIESNWLIFDVQALSNSKVFLNTAFSSEKRS